MFTVIVALVCTYSVAGLNHRCFEDLPGRTKTDRAYYFLDFKFSVITTLRHVLCCVSSCLCVSFAFVACLFDLCHPIFFFLTDCQILKWASLDGLDAGVASNNGMEILYFLNSKNMTNRT